MTGVCSCVRSSRFEKAFFVRFSFCRFGKVKLHLDGRQVDGRRCFLLILFVMKTVFSGAKARPLRKGRTFGTTVSIAKPGTETYAPPAFRSSGTKYSMVASGRSFSRAARSGRRRFNAAASCEESSRLSAVGRTGFPCCRLVARQRGKRREPRGPVAERHLRMVPRDVMRQADDVVVGRLHG